jgi:hypothetical protein
MMILNPRESLVLQAALLFLVSNVDDLNDALLIADGPDIMLSGQQAPPITETEVAALSQKILAVPPPTFTLTRLDPRT